MWSEEQEDRREQARRRLGARDPVCSCGEDDPLALVGAYPDVRCYECDRRRRGLPDVEDQHSQGQHNGPETVPMPGNDHRVVDAMKAEWPAATLQNKDGNPLLRAAGCLRGWLDTLELIVRRTVGWIPALLEALNAWLVVRLGARWWDDFTGWAES